MLNQKAIEGLLQATPEKRYKSFLTTAADREEAWGLVSDDQNPLAIRDDGCIWLWPYKEFCEWMRSPEDVPVSIEIHELLEQCQALDPATRFRVFPTKENAYTVTAEQLCRDMQEHLDEVE